MKHLFFFFILITPLLETSACDCAFPPTTFMTSISQYTAEFEVVQIDTLRADGHHQSRPLVLTKLKVLKSFNDSIQVDYVWVNNSGGSGCERGIFPDYIGQKYIITGRFLKETKYDKWIDDAAERHFLSISICGKMVLDIEGDFVIGEITKNNDQKIKRKHARLMRKDELKAEAYYHDIYLTKHHPDRMQRMTLAKFYKLMELRSFMYEK